MDRSRPCWSEKDIRFTMVVVPIPTCDSLCNVPKTPPWNGSRARVERGRGGPGSEGCRPASSVAERTGAMARPARSSRRRTRQGGGSACTNACPARAGWQRARRSTDSQSHRQSVTQLVLGCTLHTSWERCCVCVDTPPKCTFEPRLSEMSSVTEARPPCAEPEGSLP